MPIPVGGEEKTRAMVTTTGYCYSDASTVNPNVQSHMVSQLQSFGSNPEIYLTTGMEMIGLPSKNLQSTSNDTNSVMWKEFFGKPGGNHQFHHHHGVDGASSSKAINEPSSASDQFYQQDFSTAKPDFSTGISDTGSHENLMVTQDHRHQSSAAWHDNRSLLLADPTLRVVFPCEGNGRPSRGLSLSLGSLDNPSTIGLQSFELRHHQDDMRYGPSSSREGQFFGKSLNIQQQQQMMQDEFLGKAANLHHQGQFQIIRSSKYLAPAQELLNEFCNLGTQQTDHTSKLKLHKTNQRQDQDNVSSSKMHSLYTLDLLELQKRKAKLLQMLEEVDKRYKHYCNQMKAVVSSFEAVAGNGAATVYSALASKAMSRHFRCLRDGIVAQIKATKKALGEKDTGAPGTTRGETPRLRILDQTLRQQRAFQQMGMMESHPWRPQRGLPERAVSLLRAWLFEHFLNPYPSDVDKHILARQTGLSRSQVSNWFINARVRLWKPMVEEMYSEEIKEEDNMDGESVNGGLQDHQNPHHQSRTDQDQKPQSDQLVKIDSECLSSIINNPEKNDSKSSKTLHQDDDQNLQHIQQHSFGRVSDSFGAMELDFSSYNHQSYAAAAGARGTGSGVSLTLGLQQHGGGAGVSLPFSPASQNTLFYSREHMDDCQPVQYTILDSEGQNLPYRSLMGAQLLHDMAG